MPFSKNTDLPNNIKSVLPFSAQSIFRRAFNSASLSGSSEKSSIRIGWTAVKNAGFKKNKDGKWIKASLAINFKHIGISWENETSFYEAEIPKSSIEMPLMFSLEHYLLSDNHNLISIKEEEDRYIIQSFVMDEEHALVGNIILSYNPEIGDEIEQDLTNNEGG